MSEVLEAIRHFGTPPASKPYYIDSIASVRRENEFIRPIDVSVVSDATRSSTTMTERTGLESGSVIGNNAAQSVALDSGSIQRSWTWFALLELKGSDYLPPDQNAVVLSRDSEGGTSVPIVPYAKSIWPSFFNLEVPKRYLTAIYSSTHATHEYILVGFWRENRG